MQRESLGIATEDVAGSRNMEKSTGVKKIFEQLFLLLEKRKLEYLNQKAELIKYFAPPLFFFVFMILIYEVFDGMFFDGGIEDYIVPLAFWVYVQKNTVQIMYEKSTRLQEAMRMMGMSDVAYWTSYIISDGIIFGFILSMLCAILSTYGLFNNGNFGAIFGLIWLFCISSLPFTFFLSAFFDTPQTTGQATLGILLGFYVLYVALDISTSDNQLQVVSCLFPPLALQLGCASFRASYSYENRLPLGDICGMMVADCFIYSVLAWYFSQVWPSKVGTQKSPLFFLTRAYWDPQSQIAQQIGTETSLLSGGDAEDPVVSVPREPVNEKLTGRPTVQLKGLQKTFDGVPVVNKLSFDMYENQITALLGHNGAGKTTTINMLTGLFPPDFTSNGDASIYGHSVLRSMDQIRHSMGVCPQHDVLFENLTVKEHILFFSQLKGSTKYQAEQEAAELTTRFHLDERLDHLGSELSGGQKRKLSVAIAVCGGSKFVVLDEPTAGMDPLARRELWDLLSSLRIGRTILLTTHYMDADVLGDRVAIMSLGQLQCMGTTQFLKTTYGAGYKLVFDKSENMPHKELAALTDYVQEGVPGATYNIDESSDVQAVYMLPFDSIKHFGPFFTRLSADLAKLQVYKFGVMITSLEDVFLKVGEDHSVTPQGHSYLPKGIGAERAYASNFTSQIIGIAKRKLSFAKNDFVTIPLVLLPAVVAIVGAILYDKQTISKDNIINDIIVSSMYMGAYLGAPGLIAEFIVKERNDKLRNVLTVMGCDFRAYWLGTLLADYVLMSIPLGVMYLSWFAGGMNDFYTGKGGLAFFVMLVFNLYMITYSYLCTYMFTSPKSCIALMPVFTILLIIAPNIILMFIILIFDVGLHAFTMTSAAQGGMLLWGLMLMSPHGALLAALLDTVENFGNYISGFPPIEATLPIMIFQGVFYLWIAYKIDCLAMVPLEPSTDPSFDEAQLAILDEDVLKERSDTLDPAVSAESPLRVERLRKVFPPKHVGGKSVVAAQDVSFHVSAGEIFGLLGANGAGKTTTLSMLTRHLIPTAGNAFVANHSVLNDFTRGSTHLGVVTQNNSLWDLLSVEDHLKLFARLRGVPEDIVYQVVDDTIDQLELTPHRRKLAGRLSGGMKRKLCVAIALIGDPEVVLLDEPSAGLDPVSRRNLWNVILRTMSHRAVVLTTHSMEEAEALCKRIGIMVLGQLRALGTKQHLKSKFGSGYELVVKLKMSEAGSAALDTLSGFVRGMFPSAKFISDNGGLVTFSIPQTEMNMGLAFTEFEDRKVDLHVEDYHIAQATLEQVFIRTVQANTPLSKQTFGSVDRPSSWRSSSKQRLEDDIAGQPDDADDRPSLAEEAFVVLNSCGCTPKFVKIATAVSFALFVIFLAISIAAAVSALLAIAVVFFVAFLVFCILCCCPCFQPPKDSED